jgi:hypothetical protein
MTGGRAVQPGHPFLFVRRSRHAGVQVNIGVDALPPARKPNVVDADGARDPL